MKYKLTKTLSALKTVNWHLISALCVLMVSVFGVSDVLALNMGHDEALKDGIESIEKTINGGLIRIIAIGGIVSGIAVSIFKSTVMPLIIAVGIVVGGKLLLAYADGAYTALI